MRSQSRRLSASIALWVAETAKTHNPPSFGGFTEVQCLGRRQAGSHMPDAETAVFRKWARRSLFALAILAAPAAYSEVASTVTESAEPGTLLGNYLSGRVARGDHDTAAAADFYSRALAEDPKNELILEQAFLL